MSGDRLGFFVDADAIGDWSSSMRPSADGAAALPSMPAFLDDLTPAWAAGALRVESDALVLDGRATPNDTLAGPPANKVSTLAGLVPANTLLFASGNDVGGHIERLLDLVGSDPGVADALRDGRAGAGLLGGLDGDLTGSGILVSSSPAGDSVAGGLVVAPKDAAAAERLFTTLRGFVALAGASAGITVEDQAHGDDTVTVITIEDAGALLDAASAVGGAAATPAPSVL